MSLPGVEAEPGLEALEAPGDGVWNPGRGGWQCGGVRIPIGGGTTPGDIGVPRPTTGDPPPLPGRGGGGGLCPGDPPLPGGCPLKPGDMAPRPGLSCSLRCRPNCPAGLMGEASLPAC